VGLGWRWETLAVHGSSSSSLGSARRQFAGQFGASSGWLFGQKAVAKWAPQRARRAAQKRPKSGPKAAKKRPPSRRPAASSERQLWAARRPFDAIRRTGSAQITHYFNGFLLYLINSKLANVAALFLRPAEWEVWRRVWPRWAPPARRRAGLSVASTTSRTPLRPAIICGPRVGAVGACAPISSRRLCAADCVQCRLCVMPQTACRTGAESTQRAHLCGLQGADCLQCRGLSLGSSTLKPLGLALGGRSGRPASGPLAHWLLGRHFGWKLKSLN